MNTMTDSKMLAKQAAATSGKIRMTPSEAFVETLVAQGVKDTFGIVGSAYMDAHDLFPLAGIRFRVGRARAERRAHGRRLFARHRQARRVHRAERPRHHQFRDRHRRGVLGAFAGGRDHAGIGQPDHGPRRLPGNRADADLLEDHQVAGAREFAACAWPSSPAARSTIAMDERGPVQVNIPRDYFYGEGDFEIPQPQRIERAAGGPESLDAAARLLAKAKFPVILSGGGVVMANGIKECAALAEYLTAPVVNSYLHNDSFPASHPLCCGPLGYQGSKAAMKLISRADVVLALGSRLGPFGTLPQHGLDYWPKNAKIIQVDADPRMLGLVKKVSIGICGDARLAARSSCWSA